MADERWNSHFSHTIAFALFKKHFTELNSVYWSHVPAANTIEKKAYEALKSGDADPKGYFLIPDEDDRRIASTYDKWKTDYREFSNYTRLNMLMLLCSCFETYLRTIISLALESKPGVMIGCPQAVDGWFLFRGDREYGNYGSKKYQFSDAINSVCQGDWMTRAANYKHLFGGFPLDENEISGLDELRKNRNLVGHYFGREKHKYETPLFFKPDPVQRVSHAKLIEYFNLVHNAAQKIDSHLHVQFIGSYDIIKYFYQNSKFCKTVNPTVGTLVKELQKMLGTLKFPPAGVEYCRNIISYTLIEDAGDACRYSRKACVIEINRQLEESAVDLQRDGKHIRFTEGYFRRFAKAFSFRNNPEYCKKNMRGGTPEYFYSAKAIEFIVLKIKADPANIIGELSSSISKTE